MFYCHWCARVCILQGTMLLPGMFACPVFRRCESCFDEIVYAIKNVWFACRQLQYLHIKSLWVGVRVYVFVFFVSAYSRNPMISVQYCTCFLPSTELTVCCVYVFVFSYATSCRHSFFRALTPGRASPQRRRRVAESWGVVFRTAWRLWKDFKSTSYQNLFFLGVILLLLDPLKDSLILVLRWKHCALSNFLVRA